MSAYTMAISLRPPSALPARSSPLPISLTISALAQARDRKLPVLRIDVRFRQAGNHPCLAAASIPVYIGIAEGDQPKCQVTPVEAF
jgi:hypothetical protein